MKKSTSIKAMLGSFETRVRHAAVAGHSRIADDNAALARRRILDTFNKQTGILQERNIVIQKLESKVLRLETRIGELEYGES